MLEIPLRIYIAQFFIILLPIPLITLLCIIHLYIIQMNIQQCVIPIDFLYRFDQQSQVLASENDIIVNQQPKYYYKQLLYQNKVNWSSQKYYIKYGNQLRVNQTLKYLNKQNRLLIINKLLNKLEKYEQKFLILESIMVYWHQQNFEVQFQISNNYVYNDKKLSILNPNINKNEAMDKYIVNFVKNQTDQNNEIIKNIYIIQNFVQFIIKLILHYFEIDDFTEEKTQSFALFRQNILIVINDVKFHLEIQNLGSFAPNYQETLIHKIIKNKFEPIIHSQTKSHYSKSIKSYAYFKLKSYQQAEINSLLLYSEIKYTKFIINILFMICYIKIERRQFKQVEVYISELFNSIKSYRQTPNQRIPLEFILVEWKLLLYKKQYGKLFLKLKQYQKQNEQISQQIKILLAISYFHSKNYSQCLKIIQNKQFLNPINLSYSYKLLHLLEYHIQTTTLGYCYQKIVEIIPKVNQNQILSVFWIWISDLGQISQLSQILKPQIQNMVQGKFKKFLKSKLLNSKQDIQNRNKNTYFELIQIEKKKEKNSTPTEDLIDMIIKLIYLQKKLESMRQNLRKKSDYLSEIEEIQNLLNLKKYRQLLWIYRVLEIFIQIYFIVKDYGKIQKYSQKLFNFMVQHKNNIYASQIILYINAKKMISIYLSKYKYQETIRYIQKIKKKKIINTYKLIFPYFYAYFMTRQYKQSIRILESLNNEIQSNKFDNIHIYIQSKLYIYLIQLEDSANFKKIKQNYQEFLLQHQTLIKYTRKNISLHYLVFYKINKIQHNQQQYNQYFQKAAKEIGTYQLDYFQIHYFLENLCFFENGQKILQCLELKLQLQDKRYIFESLINLIQFIINLRAGRLIKKQNNLQQLNKKIQLVDGQDKWLGLAARVEYLINQTIYNEHDIRDQLYLIANTYNKQKARLQVQSYKSSMKKSTKNLQIMKSRLGNSKKDNKLKEQIQKQIDG